VDKRPGIDIEERIFRESRLEYRAAFVNNIDIYFLNYETIRDFIPVLDRYAGDLVTAQWY
jgi:hypothetical protein